MIWLALACARPPDLVTLSGLVFDDHHDQAQPIPEVQLTSYDLVLTQVDETQADGRGWFELDVVASAAMFIEVQAPGFVTSGFAGSAPAVSTSLDDGVLWMPSDESMRTTRALFGACGEQSGAVIDGKIRLAIAGYSPDDGQEWPLAVTGWAVAYDSEGQRYGACYLEPEAGAFYDESAELTGNSGHFAIFGAPTGAVTLEVGYEIEGNTVKEVFYLFVPEEGAVSLYSVYLYL